MVPISNSPRIQQGPAPSGVPNRSTANGISNGNLFQTSTPKFSKEETNTVFEGFSSSDTLSFHNINYIVGGSRTNARLQKCYPPCIKPKPGRQILHDVSGLFTPGMNAIMGNDELVFSMCEKDLATRASESIH